MTATMRLQLWTPAGVRTFEGLLRIRLEAPDGSRGVLPGHEPARVSVVPGPIVMVDPRLGERYLATEGGVAEIDRDGVRLLCRWAAQADDLAELQRQVAARRAAQRDAEQRARTVAHRHEVATRRALAGLRREVGQ